MSCAIPECLPKKAVDYLVELSDFYLDTWSYQESGHEIRLSFSFDSRRKALKRSPSVRVTGNHAFDNRTPVHCGNTFRTPSKDAQLDIRSFGNNFIFSDDFLVDKMSASQKKTRKASPDWLTIFPSVPEKVERIENKQKVETLSESPQAFFAKLLNSTCRLPHSPKQLQARCTQTEAGSPSSPKTVGTQTLKVKQLFEEISCSTCSVDLTQDKTFTNESDCHVTRQEKTIHADNSKDTQTELPTVTTSDTQTEDTKIVHVGTYTDIDDVTEAREDDSSDEDKPAKSEIFEFGQMDIKRDSTEEHELFTFSGTSKYSHITFEKASSIDTTGVAEHSNLLRMRMQRLRNSIRKKYFKYCSNRGRRCKALPNHHTRQSSLPKESGCANTHELLPMASNYAPTTNGMMSKRQGFVPRRPDTGMVADDRFWDMSTDRRFAMEKSTADDRVSDVSSARSFHPEQARADDNLSDKWMSSVEWNNTSKDVLQKEDTESPNVNGSDVPIKNLQQLTKQNDYRQERSNECPDLKKVATAGEMIATLVGSNIAGEYTEQRGSTSWKIMDYTMRHFTVRQVIQTGLVSTCSELEYSLWDLLPNKHGLPKLLLRQLLYRLIVRYLLRFQWDTVVYSRVVNNWRMILAKINEKPECDSITH